MLETGGASGVPESGAAAVAVTAVATWEPSGFVATDIESGSCWTGSIAAPRAGAYQCSAGNAIHDHCLVVSGAQQVACPIGAPAHKQGVLLNLTQALPTDGASTGRPSAAHPWAFTLQGGGTCGAMTQARWCRPTTPTVA